MNEDKKVVVWRPLLGPQKAYIDCPLPLIGFGGARGGGKTDAVLGKFGLKQERYGAGFNGVFFRQEMPQADDLIDRARSIYEPLGAQYNKVEKQFTFKKGGRLRFRPLENDDDAAKYQGQSLTDVGVEEAGNYPDKSPIFKIFGALRSGSGVPTQMTLTFNPGGSGHHWLKQLFIKPAPRGNKVLQLELNNGRKFPYVYIPSRVQDNPFLGDDYIDRLHLVGSPELVRAWLEGDFEIHEGSYFPEFSQQHIISPFKIPAHWHKYGGFDWGFKSPFCYVWGAVSSGKDDNGKEVRIPKGALVIYRELWGKQIQNVDIAKKIADLSGTENPYTAADTQIFSEDGGDTINHQFNSVFVPRGFPSFRPADKDRISGWSQIRMRLAAKPEPMIYFFSTCPYLIETIPALVMDQKNMEDVDSDGEDHGADALRYLCKARVLEPTYVAPATPVTRQGQVFLNNYLKEKRKEISRARI